MIVAQATLEIIQVNINAHYFSGLPELQGQHAPLQSRCGAQGSQPHLHTFGSEALSSLSDCRTMCLSTPPTRSSTGTTVMQFLNLQAAAVNLLMLQMAVQRCLSLQTAACRQVWQQLVKAAQCAMLQWGDLPVRGHQTVQSMSGWHAAELMYSCQASAGNSLGAVPTSHGDLS